MGKNNKTIVFNQELYSLSAIRKAIAAFQELADFNVETEKLSYKVAIKNLDQSANESLEDEFSNYVLAEMQNG